MAYNIALLADVGNFELTEIELNSLMSRISLKGDIVYGKLYNFNEKKHSDIMNIAEQYAFDIVPVSKSTLKKKKKNELEIRLVMDAIKLAIKNPFINAFCLIMGDADYTPLIVSLKAEGKYIFGVFENENEQSQRLCNAIIKLQREETQQKTKIIKVSAKKSVKKPQPNKAQKKVVQDDVLEEIGEEVVPVVKKAAPVQVKKPEPIVEEEPEIIEEEPEIIEEELPEDIDTSNEEQNIDEETQFDDEETNLEAKKQKLATSLEEFAKRTSELNFDSSEDIEEKQQLLFDIDKIIQENDFEPENASEEDVQSFTEIKNLLDSLVETIKMSLED